MKPIHFVRHACARPVRRLGLALLLLAAAVSRLDAQPALDVTLGRALNAVGPADQSDSRQTTAATVLAEQYLVGERLHLFYSLDAGSFTTPGDWTYYEHAAGATWRFGAADTSGRALFVGATALWRANGASWAAANFWAVNLFANTEWRPRSTAVVRAGYRVDIRNFADLAELNQIEHDGLASLLVSLPSRTTLVGEFHLGAKSYNTAALAPIPATPDGGSLHDAAARGRGMGSSVRWAGYSPGGGSAPVDRAGQVMVLGRVAQSLFDRTGLSLQYSQRSTFGALPMAVITTPALFFDDGVYDDPFASNAQSWRGTLKQIFERGIQLEATGVTARKDYRGTPALQLDGLPVANSELRADWISRAGVSWTLPVLQDQTEPFGLDLLVDYWFTRHRSNDAFYNYTSHAVGIGVNVSY